MTKHASFAVDDYVPVELRHRSDGWTSARQIDFLLALSESACVEDACRTVGKSPASAYALRRRVEAMAFRAAWDAALDYGVSRLGDAALSRALNGVARPVFYKGEQIGERRYFDERLTMFILRLRAPGRYGQWRDRAPFAELSEDELACNAEQAIYDTERAIGLDCEATGRRDHPFPDLPEAGDPEPGDPDHFDPEPGAPGPGDPDPAGPDSGDDVSATSSTSK